MPVDISDKPSFFVQAPAVDGFKPIYATFDGRWSSGTPVLGCPMANGGGYGSRLFSTNGENLALNGAVVFTYARI